MPAVRAAEAAWAGEADARRFLLCVELVVQLQQAVDGQRAVGGRQVRERRPAAGTRYTLATLGRGPARAASELEAAIEFCLVAWYMISMICSHMIIY